MIYNWTAMCATAATITIMRSGERSGGISCRYLSDWSNGWGDTAGDFGITSEFFFFFLLLFARKIKRVKKTKKNYKEKPAAFFFLKKKGAIARDSFGVVFWLTSLRRGCRCCCPRTSCQFLSASLSSPMCRTNSATQ